MDQRAREGLFEGQARLYKLVLNHLNSMSLKCAIELGIADIIQSHGRPVTASELASALGVQTSKTSSLFRLMRFLVHTGVFSQTEEGGEAEAEATFELTPTSTLLLKDQPFNLLPFVSAFVDPQFVSTFQSLSRWFRGSEATVWENVHGFSFVDFLNQDNEFTQKFNQAMASDSELTKFVVRDDARCKQIFDGVDSLVDVAGGNGSFSKLIAEAFPSINCTVLDLPHAVASMHESETHNLKFVAGDMFQFIPPADAYLFKMVFHGFSDEDSLKIMKKLREAIASNGEKGKVMIIDIVINEKEDPRELNEVKLLFDTMLSANINGKERTEREWGKLFSDAGFTRYKATPLFGMKSLVEVFP